MSKIFGPIFTFLLAIPLALVPLIAIVGMPSADQLANGSFGKTKLGQFVTHLLSSPESTETKEAEERDELPEAPAWGDKNTAQVASSTGMANDSMSTTGWGHTPGSSIPPVTQTSGVANMSWQQGQPVVATATAPGSSWNNYPISQQQVPQQSQGPQITWQQAVGQLNSMGIREYHLKPGRRPGEFYFFCFFTPPNRPQVTIRYEAEADDPLKAVENVLQQIQVANHQTRRPAT